MAQGFVRLQFIGGEQVGNCYYVHAFYFFHDCNRSVRRVRGFTRESLIAMTTNIESREHRRRDIATSHGLPENPRASSTDDVECFFSVLRDSTHTEKDFTLKRVCLIFLS